MALVHPDDLIEGLMKILHIFFVVVGTFFVMCLVCWIIGAFVGIGVKPY